LTLYLFGELIFAFSSSRVVGFFLFVFPQNCEILWVPFLPGTFPGGSYALILLGIFELRSSLPGIGLLRDVANAETGELTCVENLLTGFI
jgi:hypothetical protein